MTHSADFDAPEPEVVPCPNHRYVGGRCATCGWNAYEDKTHHGYVIPPAVSQDGAA